jgi:SAM-dependent methyltransferase
MTAKPAFLGPEFAASFEDASVVAAYRHRPPYPSALFDLLLDLLPASPRTILDLGCGRGDLGRVLVDHVERVDAVDASATMIARGRTLPNGDHPRLRWIHSRAEHAPLDPPYGMVVAGQSLHWMDWDVVLPKLADVLSPDGVLAIVTEETAPPWGDGVGPIVKRYSLNQAYYPFDMLAEWERVGLWQELGRRKTDPLALRQSVDDYIEGFHGRSSLSRDRMTPKSAAAFDNELRALVEPFAVDGVIELQVVGDLVWGNPIKIVKDQ